MKDNKITSETSINFDLNTALRNTISNQKKIELLKKKIEDKQKFTEHDLMFVGSAIGIDTVFKVMNYNASLK